MREINASAETLNRVRLSSSLLPQSTLLLYLLLGLDLSLQIHHSQGLHFSFIFFPLYWIRYREIEKRWEIGRKGGRMKEGRIKGGREEIWTVINVLHHLGSVHLGLAGGKWGLERGSFHMILCVLSALNQTYHCLAVPQLCLFFCTAAEIATQQALRIRN